MSNNEQLAVQTFSLVPEAYQQIFMEAGAEFPDELVSAIKLDPNQAVELLDSDKTLKKAVISIFNQNKDTIMEAAQKAQEYASLFKRGGKLDYGLRKFQQGGQLQGDIKPKGLKGLLFRPTQYPRLDKQPGYVSEYVNAPGDTLTTVAGRWTSWQRRNDKKGKPIYEISIGSEPYRKTTDPEAIQMLENTHNRFVYPEYQEGGEIRPDTRGPIAIWVDKTISNNPTLSRLDRAFRNYKQSAPGKVLDFMFPDINSEYGIAGAIVPTKNIKILKNGVQSSYKWLPSEDYIRTAREKGTSLDDFLFSLKRNPNPSKMYGKYGNASMRKLKLNPTKEEVEKTVSRIYGKPIYDAEMYYSSYIPEDSFFIHD